MITKSRWILALVLLAILVVALIYLFVTGNPSKKTAAKEEVQSYLINKQNYTLSDIASIEGSYTFKSSKCPYGAKVVFSDESDQSYSYSVCDGEVIQNGYSSENSKHKE